METKELDLVKSQYDTIWDAANSLLRCILTLGSEKITSPDQALAFQKRVAEVAQRVGDVKRYEEHCEIANELEEGGIIP